MTMVALPTTETVKEKRCTGRCNRFKPLAAFSRNPGRGDGRQSECKECVTARYYEAEEKRLHVCRKCTLPKPFSAFDRDSAGRRSRTCRECQAWGAAVRDLPRDGVSDCEARARLNAIRQAYADLLAHATPDAVKVEPAFWSMLTPREAADRVRRLFGMGWALELFSERLSDVADEDDE